MDKDTEYYSIWYNAKTGEFAAIQKNEYFVKISDEEYAELTKPAGPTLDDAKTIKISDINQMCSKSIMNGFWYEISGVSYHFSYDTFDQQNFADTANAANTSLITNETGRTVDWNGYKDIEHRHLVVLTLGVTEFLDLYNVGALKHKADNMYKAKDLKLRVEDAKTVEEVQAITWKD